MVQAFQSRGRKKSNILATFYNWCLTRDVANLTMASGLNSVFERQGWLYSQYYASLKAQWDANKRFPWPAEDDSMALMTVSLQKLEAFRAKVGGRRVNAEALRQSYLHSGRRFLMGCRLNADRSWGVREEHRISLELFESMLEEHQSRGSPELRRQETRTQFYVLRTSVVNKFSEMVALPVASWFQSTLSQGPEGKLGPDYQKLAFIQSILLKHSYSFSLLPACSILWKQTIHSHDERKLGLGLKATVEKYGFGWIPQGLIDWEKNTFANGIADHFKADPNKVIKKRYRINSDKEKECLGPLEVMQQVVSRLRPLNVDLSDELSRNKRLELLEWTAAYVMLEYHKSCYTMLHKSTYRFLKKDSKNSEAIERSFDIPPALTYEHVKAELGEEPCATGQAKKYFTKKQLFDLIFQVGRESDNPCKGQGWNQPYLNAITFLKENLDHQDFVNFQKHLWNMFNTRVHCVPNVSRYRWLAPIGNRKDKAGWIAFWSDGTRLDAVMYNPLEAESITSWEGCSWNITRSMHEHKYWNTPLIEALERYEK